MTDYKLSAGESLRAVVACDPRDWADHWRDAWLYGIVCGWDEALDCVARKHGWPPATVERLQQLHAEFNRAFPRAE